MLIPQGWGFFTKDPQEKRLYIYSSKDDRDWQSTMVKNSSLENLFGASRSARLRGVEMAEILSKGAPSPEAWGICSNNDFAACAEEAEHTQPFATDNDFTVKTMCGSVVLLQQEPNPWAYHQAGYSNGNEISYLRLEVNCD